MLKPVISKRGRARYAEIAITRGPRYLATTASGQYNDLYGYIWMAVADKKEGRIRIYQAQRDGNPLVIGGDIMGAIWYEAAVPNIEHQISDIRHISLAYDQAARYVLAYEVDGETYLQQWDALQQRYITRGPIAGRDPVLIADAVAGYYTPNSDVLLFHLSAERDVLYMRAQREQYAVAHVVQALAARAYLDQALALPYQIELIGSFVDNADQTGLVMRTDLYPVRGIDDLGTAAASPPSAAVYYPVVVVSTLDTDDLGTAAASPPSAAIYAVAVVVLNLGEAPYVQDDLGSAAVTPPQEAVYEAI